MEPLPSTSSEEQALKEALLSGRASATDGLRLYSLMTQRGAPFPLELEELVLELNLREQPERPDLIARLRSVKKMLGKVVPQELEGLFRGISAKTESERDHQRDSFEYHLKAGLRDMDDAFFPIYEKCRRYTMTSPERMFALYQAVNYILDAGIPGAFVECGAWKGGSMMVAACTLLARNASDRRLYLFDTFEGLPKPDLERDVDLWNNRAIDGWAPLSIDDHSSTWARAELEEVRNNVLTTGYPAHLVHLIKGLVEETIPSQAPDDIALLRLDTDWYASTKHEMEHLFPRLRPQGVLLIDDYGHFKGARAAVDEYLKTLNIPALLNRIDYSGRVFIKTFPLHKY